MKKLSRGDIQNLHEYEKARADFRQRVIELKQDRRIPLGDKLSLTFENRETVRFQIQEMIRAERMVDDEKIQGEIDVYNELLPGANELSATMFIEITEQNEIKPELDRFQGLDRGDCVYFEFNQQTRAWARFEAGHSKEDRISAVHYLRFTFSAEQQKWFLDPAVSVALVVNHPNYSARTILKLRQRMSLASDFETQVVQTEAGL